MNLQLKTLTYGDEVNIWDSAQRRFVRGGVTIDASTVTGVFDAETGLTRKILKAGTFLAKITATGKYAAYQSGATDGRQNPKYLLAETVDLTNGDAAASAVDHARVVTARLPAAPDATVLAGMPGITFA